MTGPEHASDALSPLLLDEIEVGEPDVSGPLQAADPRLRRLKHQRARERASMGAEARADQGEVWDAVADRGIQFMAASPTGAMSDIFEEHRDHLGDLRRPIRLRERQCGAVVAVNGRISILDYVSRPDAWADLHPALLEGYALDALGAVEAEEHADPPELSTVRGFILLAGDAPTESRTAGPGLGETIRFAANGVAGSALAADAEMVQLTAYLDGDGNASDPQLRRSRINRPSRRGHGR